MSDLLTDREPRVEMGGYWAHRDVDGQWWVWDRDGKQWRLCNPYEMILLDVIAGQRDSMYGQELCHRDYVEPLKRRAAMADELAVALKTLLTMTWPTGGPLRDAAVAVVKHYDATKEDPDGQGDR